MNDMELLKEYAARNSEDAFSTLVSRHINLVYSAAFRQVGNRQEAEEVTQAVFLVLARKARGLRLGTVLSGWLYQTARLTAANSLRREIRRQNREQKAYMQSTLNEPEPDPWTQVGPLLEQAMSGLSEADRNAIVLRYFENKQLKEVGAALGTTDDAAKMRINRALEKLRTFFLKRGVTLSAAALGAAISAHSIEAAPAGLCTTVVAVACQGSALTASTMTLAKGTLKFMAWTKLNIAVGVGAAAVIALQWNQIATQKNEVAVLQEQFAQATRQNALQRATIIAKPEKQEIPAAPREITQLQRDNARLAARNASLRATIAAAPPPGRGENALAKMMNDPDVMKSMQDMQGQMIKKQYAALVKQLNLTPEQADAFYGLVVGNQTNMSALGMQMLSGTNYTDVASASKAAMKATDDQLQSLLGEKGYAQYKDYQSGMVDRTMLEQMQSEFADSPLSEDQQQRLLQVMKTQREATPGSDTSDLNKYAPGQDPIAVMNQGIQSQEIVNQKVLQQAGDFLSPAQIQMLGASQSNLLSAEKMGMIMAQKMFNPPQAAK